MYWLLHYNCVVLHVVGCRSDYTTVGCVFAYEMHATVLYVIFNVLILVRYYCISYDYMICVFTRCGFMCESLNMYIIRDCKPQFQCSPWCDQYVGSDMLKRDVVVSIFDAMQLIVICVYVRCGILATTCL